MEGKIDNELLKVDKKTPIFSLSGLSLEAKCVKCYDADTVHLVFFFNNNFQRFCCRLHGIDCAEIRSKDPEEKKQAREARDFVRSIILDKVVDIECLAFDKYGRLLVKIYLDEVCLNDLLISKKYAYQYLGGRKKKFSEWQ